MENLRSYVSRVLFYDDQYYEMFSQEREYLIDQLLDTKKSKAGFLDVTDTYILRKRLGIGLAPKTIEQIAEEFCKEASILHLVECRIYSKIRDFYRNKPKGNNDKMSSLDIYPDRSLLYNKSITSIDYSDETKMLKKRMNEHRFGYILRFTKKEMLEKSGSLENVEYITNIVHSQHKKMPEELTFGERKHAIAINTLDSVLNSPGEWVTSKIKFVSHFRIIDLVIAASYEFLDSEKVFDILKKFGIDVEYPYIYKGNDAAEITKKDLLNFPIECMNLPINMYRIITSNYNNYKIIDLLTFGSNRLELLEPDEREYINNIIKSMNLSFVIGEGKRGR